MKDNFGRVGGRRKKKIMNRRRTPFQFDPYEKKEKDDDNSDNSDQTALATQPEHLRLHRGHLLCVSTHWHRWRGATLIGVWWNVRGRGHHHRVRVLHCRHHCKCFITTVLINKKPYTVDSDDSMGGRASGSALEASMVEVRRHWGWAVGGTHLAAAVACMLEMTLFTLVT